MSALYFLLCFVYSAQHQPMMPSCVPASMPPIIQGNVYAKNAGCSQPMMPSSVPASMPPIIQGNVYAKNAGCSRDNSIKAFPLQPPMPSGEDMIQIRRTSTGSVISFQTDISSSSLGKPAPIEAPPVNNPHFELPSIVEEREATEPSSGSVISFRTNIPGKVQRLH